MINLDNKSVAISSNFGMVWFRMGETRDLDVTSEAVIVPSKLMILRWHSNHILTMMNLKTHAVLTYEHELS